MPRGRNWVFTWNVLENAINESWTKLNELAAIPTVLWMVCQLERAPTTNQFHWQGTIYFKNARTLGGCKRLLDQTVHWEIARGTFHQQKTYCLKDESRAPPPYYKSLEAGEMPSQGRRSDILQMIAYIDDHPNVTELELWRMDPNTMIQYGNRMMRLVHLQRPVRSWTPVLIVLWGPTGTGKSYRAHTWAQEAGQALYVMPTPPSATSQPWVDGYDAHPIVLLDDFEDQVPYRTLLQMIDGYPMQMPVKGAFVNFAPRFLVITSNINPEDWYLAWAQTTTHAQTARDPLLRRLRDETTTIHHVTRRDLELTNPFNST